MHDDSTRAKPAVGRGGAAPRHPIPQIDPAIARLSEMLLALLSQVTVIRERLDTVERLIEKHGLFMQDDIDGFAPDESADLARTAMRKRQIQKVMRPLLTDTVRAKAPVPGESPSEQDPTP